MRPITAAPVLLALVVLAGCQSGGATTAGKNTVASPGASASPATSAAPSADPSAASAGSGTPKTDPCSLLTKGMAEGALGLAVGPPATVPVKGFSLTCFYKPADGRPNVFVLLTTYAASGKAALAYATKAFPDARPVPDLGDAALVSRKGHAIGVADGDLLFAISLLRADGLSVSPAISEAQLITLTRTVLRSR